jgi:hypothetical protein
MVQKGHWKEHTHEIPNHRLDWMRFLGGVLQLSVGCCRGVAFSDGHRHYRRHPPARQINDLLTLSLMRAWEPCCLFCVASFLSCCT